LPFGLFLKRKARFGYTTHLKSTNMKPITKVLFVFIALTTLLVSCNEEKCCEHGLARGVLSKDWVYTNDSMKLKMQLPRDWNLMEGMGYLPLSVDNDKTYSTDYVYTAKELEDSRKNPDLLIDDLFKITKTLPVVSGSMAGPVVRFQIVRSTSLYHTAKEDIEQMIRDYDEAKLNIDKPRIEQDISERYEKMDLPGGKTFYYFFFNNNMDNNSVAIGIIHKDCYNLKIMIGANEGQLLEQTLKEFSGFWLEY
jgi:hypothetical protein